MRIEIRRIREGEGDQLMRIRLMSLIDAPYAFASTYVDSVQRPAEDWEERATRSASSDEEAIFIAEAPTGWLGIIGAFTPDDPGHRHLWGMWVDPSIRSQGVGEAMVETIVEWAALQGAQAASLWVADTNTPAVRLYERTGFVRDGRTQPMPNDETVTEVRMVRGLTARREAP